MIFVLALPVLGQPPRWEWATRPAWATPEETDFFGLDLDDDGYITVAELRVSGVRAPRRRAREADSDMDGRVNLQEFIDLVRLGPLAD